MKVSVVIPTYNRSHVIGRALESVLAQTYGDVEILIVDDGSIDGTAERLGRVRDARVRYVRRGHAGVSATRNAGVALATGELISFLDSDDLWKPDKLEREVGFLAGHPDVQAVFSDLEKYDGDLFVPSFMRASPLFGRWLGSATYPEGVVLPRREMFLFLLQEVFIKPSALTLHREAFKRTGGFDETWTSSEDWDFLLRFSKWAQLGYLDRPLAVLRLSVDSLHRIDQPRGETAMLGLLARERDALRHDPEALAAVQRGLRERVKQFAWYYAEAGCPLAATRIHLRGFRITRDPELLVRAAGGWVPRAFRAWLVGCLRRARRRPAAGARRGVPSRDPERQRTGAGRAP
jgi:hypothetical protein